MLLILGLVFLAIGIGVTVSRSSEIEHGGSKALVNLNEAGILNELIFAGWNL